MLDINNYYYNIHLQFNVFDTDCSEESNTFVVKNSKLS